MFIYVFLFFSLPLSGRSFGRAALAWDDDS